jgi:hypothetical protein
LLAKQVKICDNKNVIINGLINKIVFDIIKSFIWIVVILVIGYFVLGYFGYEVNMGYFSDSKKNCQEKIKDCTDTVIHKGLDGTNECSLNCVDPQLIIKKK